MCMGSPSVHEPTRYSEAKAPVYRDQRQQPRSTGRRGTMLTGGSGAQPAMAGTAGGTGKTLLGA